MKVTLSKTVYTGTEELQEMIVKIEAILPGRREDLAGQRQAEKLGEILILPQWFPATWMDEEKKNHYIDRGMT